MDREKLRSWGGGHSSNSQKLDIDCEKDIPNLLQYVDERGVIPRAFGNSYGDQALNSEGTVASILNYAESNDLTITKEGRISIHGGVHLGAVLEAAIHNSWILPVVPGSEKISIGGAIAADAHGKNHFHKDSIASHILEMNVLTTKETIIRCSRSEEPELFWATIGGLGLTGLILRATLQLERIESNELLVTSEKFTTYDELFNHFKAESPTRSYSVAWLDLLSNKNPGRGIIQFADFGSEFNHSFDHKKTNRFKISRPLPFNTISKLNCNSFNAFKFRNHPSKILHKSISIPGFLYPLDRLIGWNNLYGKKGLFQWQIVVPHSEEILLKEIIQTVGTLPVLPTLAVLKRLGSESNSYLSFCKPGWTLAVDFPNENASSRSLLSEFDRKITEVGGRVYLAKDSGLEPELVSEMYPRFAEWKQIRKKYSQENFWQSDFSRRLKLD